MTTLSTNISTQNPKAVIYTTLNRIREQSPCSDGWKRLIRHLGTDFPMDKPFPMVEILNAKGDGLGDCLWALRVEPQHAKLYRLYAVNRARSVQHLMNDPRSIAAIDVAERYAHGTATEDELDAARGAAWAAAWAAARGATEDELDAAGGAAWAATEDELDAARGAAWGAAWAATEDELDAAGAATEDELDAARAAAWAAARGATEDELDAAGAAAWAAARGAAGAAAGAAAWAAAWAAAATELREMLTNHHAMPGEPAL